MEVKQWVKIVARGFRSINNSVDNREWLYTELLILNTLENSFMNAIFQLWVSLNYNFIPKTNQENLRGISYSFLKKFFLLPDATMKTIISSPYKSMFCCFLGFSIIPGQFQISLPTLKFKFFHSGIFFLIPFIHSYCYSINPCPNSAFKLVLF